jgi:sensor histidine kinase YesM
MTLREEFDFLQNYLQIEQACFGYRLNVDLILDPLLTHERSDPPLAAIVENALRHRLAPKGGKGLLEIHAVRHGGIVEVLIRDNGIGYQGLKQPRAVVKKNSRGSGLGLANTAARPQTIYGNEASLSIDAVPAGGCRVTISYPLKTV